MNNRLLQLLQMLESSPDDGFLLFAIAKEHEGMQDFATAKRYYIQLKTLEPNYIGLYYHLGKLHEELDENTEALAIYADGVHRARTLGDQHALAELQSAKLNLEMDV